MSERRSKAANLAEFVNQWGRASKIQGISPYSGEYLRNLTDKGPGGSIQKTFWEQLAAYLVSEFYEDLDVAFTPEGARAFLLEGRIPTTTNTSSISKDMLLSAAVRQQIWEYLIEVSPPAELLEHGLQGAQVACVKLDIFADGRGIIAQEGGSGRKRTTKRAAPKFDRFEIDREVRSLVMDSLYALGFDPLNPDSLDDFCDKRVVRKELLVGLLRGGEVKMRKDETASIRTAIQEAYPDGDVLTTFDGRLEACRTGKAVS